MVELRGQRIVITGSSRGLGRATAIAMSQAGAKLVINGTNETALGACERAIRAAGGDVVAVPGSVGESAVCSALVETCVDHYGGIGVLINNAGQVRDRTLLKMTDEDFDEVINVHLRGTWACGKYAALAMRDQGSGQIINIISNSGLCGGFGQSNYAAAKADMMGLLRTWVLELTRFGIRCNAFWPIATTDMTQVVFDRAAAAAAQDNHSVPSPEALGFGSAEEVAQGLVWLASDAARHFNGQCVTFNGRKTALWTHPKEVHETFHTLAWSAEELADHYAGVAPEPIYSPRFIED